MLPGRPLEPRKSEPWLRGILPDIDPVIGHLLRANQHIREDAAWVLGSLAPGQLWATRAGFHAKHLAGSTERLCTYLEGGQLSAEQVAAASHEAEGSETPAELLLRINGALDLYERIIRELKPEEFEDVREVGRKRLPVTAISLAIHITEHGMRHLGQLISSAKPADG